jgi:predicted DNA-binding transcriptional regulator AlpA
MQAYNNPNGAHTTERFLSEREAAQYLNVSCSLLQKMRMAGYCRRGVSGPSFHRFGGAIRYSMAELEAWVEANRRLRTQPSDVA